MDVNFENGTVTIFGKQTKLETLITKFTQLSGEQIYNFLRIRGVLVPRCLNVMAMRRVLNEKIKYLNSNSLSSNYFMRLQGYEYFSEELLFNLFTKIAPGKDDFFEYRYHFFKLLVENYAALDFSDADFNHIKELSKTPIESFADYYRYISVSLADQKDTFDGINQAVLKEHLDEIATADEVRLLSQKYNLNLPVKLDENQMTIYVLHELGKKGKDVLKFSSELKGKTTAEIEKLAKKSGVIIHSNLTKEDSINYLFFLLETTVIERSSVQRVASEVEPLKFTVDAKAVNPFGKGPVRKVIYYEGDDTAEEVEKYNLVAAKTAVIKEPENEAVICYYSLGKDLEENLIVDDLIRGFASLSGRQVSAMLARRHVKVPRRINLYAMVSVLNERIKFLKSNDLPSDYYSRLLYYKSFSEEQCFNLFLRICKDDESFFAYRYNFFRLLVINNASLELSLDEMVFARNHPTEEMESFKDYYTLVTRQLVDQEKSFDGIDINTFEEVIPESAPANEIRQIAAKHGVSIPQRLNKGDFVRYIDDYVTKNKLNLKHEKEFNDMTLNELSEFCENNFIGMSAALTKTELVTYLFYKIGVRSNLSPIKEIYISKEFIPLDFEVDLDNVSLFGKGDPVPVVHFAGEENAEYKKEIIPMDPAKVIDDSYFGLDDFDFDEFMRRQNGDEVVEEEPQEAVVEETPVENEVVEKTFTISFENYGYGTKPEPITGLMSIPEDLPQLTSDGLVFEKWFMDEEFTTPASPNMVLEKDLTLHAKWSVVKVEEPVTEEVAPVVDEEPKVEEPVTEEATPVVEDEPKEEKPEEENLEEETFEDAEVADEVADENLEAEEKEEVKDEEEPQEEKKLDLFDSEKNEFYGSKKIDKLGKSKKGKIIGLSIAGVLVAGAAAVIVLMLTGIL